MCPRPQGKSLRITLTLFQYGPPMPHYSHTPSKIFEYYRLIKQCLRKTWPVALQNVPRNAGFKSGVQLDRTNDKDVAYEIADFLCILLGEFGTASLNHTLTCFVSPMCIDSCALCLIELASLGAQASILHGTASLPTMPRANPFQYACLDSCGLCVVWLNIQTLYP